ncbi:hypothetical protein [Streptomyces sp. NPDC005898]|uniref:hypothetical protein n=1 Tax=Streptomyces sp. NPDC005898 TaxID=3157082 RepID=UPI0033F8E60E
MPDKSHTSGRRGLVCCLLFTVLPVVWLVAAPVLPERVLWFPFWMSAAIWNGADGQGGISSLFG